MAIRSPAQNWSTRRITLQTPCRPERTPLPPPRPPLCSRPSQLPNVDKAIGALLMPRGMRTPTGEPPHPSTSTPACSMVSQRVVTPGDYPQCGAHPTYQTKIKMLAKVVRDQKHDQSILNFQRLRLGSPEGPERRQSE